MATDIDFNEPREEYTKIDYKKVFFNPKEGTNTLRIVGYKREGGKWELPGKSFKVHYVNNIKGQKVFVKSPGAGDPLIAEGSKPRTRYYLKVIDRESGLLKVWEFGSQIKQSIDEFSGELKEKRAKGTTDEDDVLTSYNLELRKRKPGSNPLYTLSIRDRLDKKVLASDQEIIDADEIDFEPLLKPWSIERIKEQILGQAGAGGSDSSAPSAPASAPVARQASAAPAPTVPAGAPGAASWLDED